MQLIWWCGCIWSHTTRLAAPMYFNWLLITVTLASSNSVLSDDGVYTETCWSCFNVNFNTPFIAVLLCISWWKNFDNIKMHSKTVKTSLVHCPSYWAAKTKAWLNRYSVLKLEATGSLKMLQRYYLPNCTDTRHDHNIQVYCNSNCPTVTCLLL